LDFKLQDNRGFATDRFLIFASQKVELSESEKFFQISFDVPEKNRKQFDPEFAETQNFQVKYPPL